MNNQPEDKGIIYNMMKAAEDAMVSHNNDVLRIPSIAAECAKCGRIYDLKFVLDCPECHHVGVKWARIIADYPGKLCSPYAHTEGDLKDIAELNHLYALEDKR
jgi:hypothetical protein